MALIIGEQNGGNFLTVTASGKVTKADYERFGPHVEGLIQQHGKLRILFVMKDFHGWDMGAVWEDIKFDMKHFKDIERLAIVGEAKWEEWMAGFCRPFTTAEIKYFDASQIEAARQWLGAPQAADGTATSSAPAVSAATPIAAAGPASPPLELQKNSLVAVYASHEGAEEAIKALQSQGFDMTRLSIVGKDYHSEEHVAGYYTTGDRMKAWGAAGAFWGGLWGFLFGAFFFVPGIGPILVAGPLVAMIVSTLEGAIVVGGLSALGAALASAGIPENSVLKYETDLRAGKYLLFVQGTRADIDRAKALLELTHHEGVTEHLAA